MPHKGSFSLELGKAAGSTRAGLRVLGTDLSPMPQATSLHRVVPTLRHHDCQLCETPLTPLEAPGLVFQMADGCKVVGRPIARSELAARTR